MALISRRPPPAETARRAAAPAPGAGSRAPSRRTPQASGAKAGGRDPLKALGLPDARHALLVAPASYVDTRQACTVVSDDLLDMPSQLFRLRYTGAMTGYRGKARIWDIPSEKFPSSAALNKGLARGTQRTHLHMADASGTPVQLTMFTGPFQWLDLQPGQEILVVGTLRQFGRQRVVAFELRVPETAADSGVWTRYRGKPGQISAERVELLVSAARTDADAPRHCTALILGATGMREEDLLQAAAPDPSHRFASLPAMLAALHRPSSVHQGMAALTCSRRISAIAIQAAALRHHSRPAHPSAPLPVDATLLDRLVRSLPMPLTAGQQLVAEAIVRRLAEPVPLSALLSGDVGTGKTIAFLLPALVAHLAGARVAIMSPMKLLADQIAREVISRFGEFTSNVERIEAGDRINDPQAILIGTGGLVSAARKAGYVPHVLICDEQHKLSTAAREALVGAGTHLVEVSATPVPRSLAATLYEGMEILNLRECPVRKTIHSHLIDEEGRPVSIAAIRQALARGERAAIVYPRVTVTDEDSAAGVQSVQSAFELLDKAFPGQVVMLHGQMDDEAIKANIDTFRRGDRRLVIASTVLEIGIDIPSVSVMVVRDADAFGISQLHQLRGRLVRNGGEGHFFMYVDDIAALQPDTLERLEAVKRTTDGYELAEVDLLQRGFGDLDGEAQTGESQTLFRLIRLSAGDFVGSKLRAVNSSARRPAPVVPHHQLQVGRRQFAQEDERAQRSHVQQRLL